MNRTHVATAQRSDQTRTLRTHYLAAVNGTLHGPGVVSVMLSCACFAVILL